VNDLPEEAVVPDTAAELLDDDVESAPPVETDAVESAEAAEAERDGYLVDLQRVTADFANFRKQVDRRNAEVRANAAVALVEKLLPVLDACDAALMQGVSDVEPIRAAFVDTLAKEGLEVHDPLGEPFDPEQHEAVMTEDGDGDAVVTEVLRTGYAWNGRIVRPAMVKVRG
jgi:molecular chaperone GrpE